MADEILLKVTEKIKSALEKDGDANILEKIIKTDSGDVIEYKYVSRIFKDRKKQG